MPDKRIIAVGLLSQRDLDLLGDQFTRLWRVEETPCFTGMLQAIDEADREFWRERNRSGQMAQDDPEIIITRQNDRR
jgi:hypothetical protein